MKTAKNLSLLFGKDNPLFQYSITPILHYSLSPSLQYFLYLCPTYRLVFLAGKIKINE